MKKALKVIAIILCVLILIIGVFAAYINFSSAPTYAEVEIPDLAIEVTAERIERGKSLVMSGCQNCHGNNGTLEGKYFEDEGANQAFGAFYTSNLTQHKTAGIGNYSDGELYRLLRTGVRKDNNLNGVVMPKWVLASEEDIHSIIAFLRSDDKMVQSVDKVHPKHESTFLEKALKKFAFKPDAYKESYQKNPSLEQPTEYGKYIVQSEALCFYCHSENIEAVNAFEPEKTPNYMAGGYVFKMKDYEIEGPSLLIDDKSNVGKWTEEEFVKAVKSGIRPNQPAYLQPMHPFAHYAEEEVEAIYTYLQEISE